MTQGKNLKRLVRARMKRTGERYMVALRAISEGRPEPVRVDPTPTPAAPLSSDIDDPREED